MGHVLQAGQGQITARQAAIGAGIPKESPAITVNKVCLSGMSAIAIADQMIRAGEVEIIVAGGMESMTNAPFVVPKAREGSRFGDSPMLDSLIHDGLWCAFDDQHMGAGHRRDQRRARRHARGPGRWAARSHVRAHRRLGTGAARRRGRRGGGPPTQGRSGACSRGTRACDPTRSPERLARLRPAFTPGGDGHRRQRLADLRRCRRRRGRQRRGRGTAAR